MQLMDTSEDLYEVLVFHRSYFCGKLLAYLRYKEIPHTRVYEPLAKCGEALMDNTGLRQMPVVKAPDGTWLQDTTPMIDWFEERHPEPPVLPGDPVVAFLTRLVEDYADEWMWRPAIHYRWAFQDDRRLYMSMFPKEFLGGIWAAARPLTFVAGHLVHKHQRDKFLAGDGMTADNVAHVESIYLDTLDRLEHVFQRQPFLLGNRPSLADYGFFGSMFYHFSNDPTPNRIMQDRAPGVYEWVARMWNARSSRLKDDEFLVSPDEVPAEWAPILADVCEAYLPYLGRNAKEFDKGSKRFDLTVQGYDYPQTHVSPYRVWCRERLQTFLFDLPEDAQERVRSILDPLGGWQPLTEDAHIRSGWDPDGIAPRCKPGPIPRAHKLAAPFTGSNHIRTVRAWRI